METEGIQVQVKENQEKETIVSRDLEDAKQASEGIREKYDALDTYLAELEEAISKAGNEKNKSNMEMGSLEGRINVLKEQINTEQMNAEHIAGRMRAIDSEIQMKMAQAATYEEERSVIADQVKTAVNELKEAEEVLYSEEEKIRLLEQQIEEGKSSIIDILNEKASLTVKQQRYETMLEQVNVRRSEVCQKLLKFKSDESEQEEQLGALQKEADEIETRIAEGQEAQAFSENRAEELEGEVKRLNKNLNDKQQEYHTSYTKLESLRNIAERYEGYGGSIRRIMEVRDRVHGIHGVVADLITVPKKNMKLPLRPLLAEAFRISLLIPKKLPSSSLNT